MRPLLIATSNQGKQREFSVLLEEAFELRFPSEAQFSSIVEPKVVEDGTTYQENALLKAKAYFEAYQIPALADDSGLEVVGLDGGPGLYSARYGGETLSWPERWKKLIGSLSEGEPSLWEAQFRAVLCYYQGAETERFYEGVAKGRILSEPTGTKGFGYDPIFYSEGLGKSFGQASFEEKQSVSHRALAVDAFLKSFQ